jgi:SAM-dependent methyltransferase/uncharacterized protein YndB with AHSA1/START domain
MSDDRSSMRISVDVPLDRAAVFAALIDELPSALARRGLHFETGAHGRLTHAGAQVGRVISWEPAERIVLEWHPATWDADTVTQLELRFESIAGVTRLTVEHRGWGSLITAKDATGWFASAVAAPFFCAATPAALTDWITDRMARRPSGADSREIYRNPLFHYPNFRVILAELDLKPADYLLEVACGGGALLREALQSGCRAAAIDHSPDMVRVARENNRDAIDAGRLEVVEGNADRLPFADETFTCAAMTGVFGFLQDPVGALSEIRRVLAPGGRLVALGSDPKWRGTPAAPEPIASRLHFYEDHEFAQLARSAGFESVQVVRRDLE